MTRVERFGRLWVPEDAPGGRRYLIRSLLVPHGRRQRLGLAVSRIDPDESASVAAGDPRFAAVPIALASVAEKGEPPRWILMEDYEGGSGRSIVFLFADGEAEHPFAAVKVHPAGDRSPLRRERDALERLAVSGVRESVPAVRGFREEDGWESLVLTTLPGQSIYRQMKAAPLARALVAGHFESAAGWLERFQETGVGMHGDFWGRNILVDDGKVAAVDWEDFDAAGDPFVDVFHFPLTYALAFRWDTADGLPAVERFGRAFAGRNAVSKATASWMRRFAGRSGVGLDDLRRRFCEHLARGAAGEIDRPRLQAAEWSAMLEQMQGGTRCAFSG
jgi:hypothetical protein